MNNSEQSQDGIASAKPLPLLPSVAWKQPPPHGGRAHPPRPWSWTGGPEGEAIIDPGSLPGQKVGAPSKEEAGIQGHAPSTSPRDASESVSKGNKSC